MIAHKCDRCGILYEEYGGTKTPNSIVLRYMCGDGRGYTIDDYDLCPKCSKEIMSFIGKKLPSKVVFNDEDDDDLPF